MNSSDYAGAATCCTVTEYGIMYGQKQMPSQERSGDQQNCYGKRHTIAPPTDPNHQADDSNDTSRSSALRM